MRLVVILSVLKQSRKAPFKTPSMTSIFQKIQKHWNESLLMELHGLFFKALALLVLQRKSKCDVYTWLHILSSLAESYICKSRHMHLELF